MTFEEFDFPNGLLDGIDALGFTEATPIQQQAIPLIMEGKDLIACAQTGTGKTGAFLLPLISQISDMRAEKGGKEVAAIVIVPTRELAVQIDQQLEGLAYFEPISSLSVYGGNDGPTFVKEKKALSEGVDIVIATPGKLISHLNLGYVKFDSLQYLVLDEADRMLDMGFYEDIMKIISYLPKKRQSLLFSATMPPKIRKLSEQILQKPEQLSIAISKPAKGIVQAAFLVYDAQKINLVKHLLQDEDMPSILIFASTKKKVKETAIALKKARLSAKGIHSDLEQKEREEVLREFRSRKLTILVATDILARGIDIEDINMVINFDVPNDAADYVHRIGRTARASSTGEAITFINEYEQQKFQQIEELIEQTVRKVDLPSHIPKGPEYQPNKQVRKPYSKSRNDRNGSGGNKKKKFFKKKK